MLKIEVVCVEIKERFSKLGAEKYEDIISKLEYVLGSYHHDNNPVGLYEMAEKSLPLLLQAKKVKPRSVPQKLIKSIESALKEAKVFA